MGMPYPVAPAPLRYQDGAYWRGDHKLTEVEILQIKLQYGMTGIKSRMRVPAAKEESDIVDDTVEAVVTYKVLTGDF